ncbi:MAG TPA: PAS domain S-box protein [Capsulimonadaceae bacterium]|jgi:PAS domain S-box-containing protein
MPLENFSQDIVDTLREPLLMLDTTLRVHSANQAFYQTFQVSQADTENRLIYELGNGQWDIPALRTLLEDIVPKNSVFNNFELAHTFPFIGRRIMLLNARQLKGIGHTELLMLAMEDVTERRRAEDDVKAIETYAQNIVDTVREPLLILDTTLRIHSANLAFYQTFHVTSEETEHHLIYELGNGQWDIPDLRRLLEDVVPKSSVFNDFELEHDFPLIGRRVMLLNARRLLEGPHGELLVLAMEDVTPRKRAEEALHKAGALQSAIFNSANFSSIATDAKGVIQIFNVGAERMLGYTAAEVVNKITPADISDAQEVVARAIALSEELATPITPGFEALVFKASRGIEDIYELTYIRKDGSRFPAVVSVTALRDEQDAIIGYLLIGTDNTARKEAEDALVQAGALQSAIFNSANFSSIATDAKGVIQIFNVGAERMLGYVAADVINTITPADISDPQELIARAAALSLELGTLITPGFEALVFKAARGIEDIYELTYIRKDGSRFAAVVSVTALRDAQGTIIGYLLIGTDNTVRKQVEEEQKKLDQRLRDQQFYTRSLIESNIDALMTTDPRGIISDVNKQMEALTGCSRDELIGSPFKSYFTDANRAEAGIKLVLAEKKLTDYELTVRSRDDHETVVSYNATTFYDRDRKLQGVFAAARDVTVQKQASQYARSLIEASVDPLVTISGQGKITDVNEASVQATGVPRVELIDTDFSDYFTEPDKARAGYQKAFSEGYVRDYPLAIRHVSGRIMDVLYNAAVYKDDKGKVLGVFAAARDVTERKRFEASLHENNVELELAIESAAKAKELAETANKTKSLFLANMSHELRTPLNAILGYSEMLQEDAADKGVSEFLPDLQKIHGAGKHLLSLINDILDLSKIEAGKMELYCETFSVPKLIAEVVETIRPLVIANSNTLSVTCPTDLGTMYADMTKTRQSLYNLLSNAAKFTKEGSITLDVSRHEMEAREWIWFRVSDTGIGMTPDQLLKLFQTFSQADTSTTRKFGGSGLGLALTRRFCQLMGGDVTVNSVSGERSTFTIKVPAEVREQIFGDPSDVGRASQVTLDSGNDTNGTMTVPEGTCVLVIDDDPTQCDLMSRFLTHEGYNVQTAGNGSDGIRMARKLKPVAITLDVMMPGMDGWSVLELLKADPEVAAIPVVMLTMMDDKKRGLELGASNYLTKPTDHRRLGQILKMYSCPDDPCPVLVVDDDTVARKLTRQMLERAGWTVTEAANELEALQKIADYRPSLILLDLSMPDTDGFAFAADIHAREGLSTIPIVVLTDHELTHEDVLRLNGNVHTILDKGRGPREDLMLEVRDLLALWAPRSCPQRPAPNATSTDATKDAHNA